MGTTLLPPDWVFGPWAVGDFGYDDLAWDESRLPEPLRMIQWMEGKGTKFALWIAPWAKGDMADEANQNGYTVENASLSYPFNAPLIDLTNPAAIEWWQHAIFWGGDTSTSHWGLRSAIIAVLRNAVMNFPIWGSDTCGYGRSTYEVCARWLAFSAFCPLMEVGPTDNVAPWSRVPDGQSGNVGGNGYDYQPEYNQALIAIWSLYANIHNDLKEYTLEQARLAHEQGTPIVRPMIYVDPHNPDYKDLFEQYLFGPDILVAPVWQEGQTTKDVHIPDGRWVDAWTGQEQTPNSVVTVDVPDHKIPIFIRAESPVDLGDLYARWQAAQTRAAQKPDLAVLAAKVE